MIITPETAGGLSGRLATAHDWRCRVEDIQWVYVRDRRRLTIGGQI